MTVKYVGSTSGYVAVDAPAVAGTTSVILPGSNGVLLAANTNGNLNWSNAIITANNLTVGGSVSVANVLTFADSSTIGMNYNISTGYSLGTRNRIINGNMFIDQRNDGATVTIANNVVGGTVTLDRWSHSNYRVTSTGGTTITIVRDNSASPYGQGFPYSCKWTNTSATTSIGAGDYVYQYQSIEGLNIQDLAWGNGNAVPVTLSFLMYTSVASAVIPISLRNGAATRSYVTTVTAPATPAWTKYTITIPGCTDGVWSTDVNIGMTLGFDFGSGSNLNSPSPGTWQNGNYITTNTGTKLIATAGATCYITGVQLERGSSATPYEWLPFTTQLALCQRYYYSSVASRGYGGNGPAYWYYTIDGFSLAGRTTYPVAMRTAPRGANVTLISTTGVTGSVRQWDSADIPAAPFIYDTLGNQIQFTSGGRSTSAFYVYDCKASAEFS